MSAAAPLQLLRCERDGLLYGVPVSAIESIERGRTTPPRTLLLPRGGGVPVEVDRAGNVAEVGLPSLMAAPPHWQAHAPGLLGLVELEGQTLPVVDLQFLRERRLPAPPLKIPQRPPTAAAPATSQDSHALLLFPVDAELLVAIPAWQVLEVREPGPWVPLPLDGGTVGGLLAWRGQAAPVVEPSVLLGREPSTERVTRVLIVRGTASPAPLAVLVRAMLQRGVVTGTIAVKPAVCGIPEAAVRGVWRWRGRLLAVPDFDALL